MSGMMSNAVGGPAAGVGGLSDISSLIEAWVSSLWHSIDVWHVFKIDVVHRYSEVMCVIYRCTRGTKQNYKHTVAGCFDVAHRLGLWHGVVCLVSLSGQQFAQQIQQQNPELIEQLRNHIRSRSFSGSAEEHSWSRQVRDRFKLYTYKQFWCKETHSLELWCSCGRLKFEYSCDISNLDSLEKIKTPKHTYRCNSLRFPAKINTRGSKKADYQ